MKFTPSGFLISGLFSFKCRFWGFIQLWRPGFSRNCFCILVSLSNVLVQLIWHRRSYLLNNVNVEQGCRRLALLVLVEILANKFCPSAVVPALQSNWFYNTQSDVWYEHFLVKRSSNNKPSSSIIRCLVSCANVVYFQTSYPVLPWILLTRCVDVFVEDLFMLFRFVSFQSKATPGCLL